MNSPEPTWYVYRIDLADAGMRGFVIAEYTAPTVEAMVRDLRGGPVTVRQLHTRPDPDDPNCMLVLGHREIGIGPMGVSRITVPTRYRYARYEDYEAPTQPTTRVSSPGTSS